MGLEAEAVGPLAIYYWPICELIRYLSPSFRPNCDCFEIFLIFAPITKIKFYNSLDFVNLLHQAKTIIRFNNPTVDKQ